MTDTQTIKATAFKRWYEANKESLAERRKRRYHENEKYRKELLAKSAESRKQRRMEALNLPPQYVHTHSDVSEKLGIDPERLRFWLRKNYYPTPFSLNKRNFFTEGQLNLLSSLAAFFQAQPQHRRMGPIARKQLDELVSVIFANW